jgi:hypothetical protein
MSRRPEAGMTPSDFGDLLSPQEHALGSEANVKNISMRSEARM